MNYHPQLEFLEDLFFNTASIRMWHFSDTFQPLSGTTPAEITLKNIFVLSTCYDYMKDYFSKQTLPVFLFDDLFFLWAAVPECNNETLRSVYLLGPVFNSYTSDHFIREKMNVREMSVKSRKTLLDLTRKIPIIPTAFFSNYICQLYYTLNERTIVPSDIQFQKQKEQFENIQEESFSRHSPYYYETLLLKSIEDGIALPNFASQIAATQIGSMCPGSPLRQKKDEAIAFSTLFTRAAICGGCLPETAFNLSDYYIQSVEAANTLPQVIQLTETMYYDYVRHVSDIRQKQIDNSFVRNCMTYLDEHFTEEIDLDLLAKDFGYTKYYFTLRFKKESGISVSQYLINRRIDYAKTLLEIPELSMQDISEALHFSSPSHFSSVFRKITGITPTRYRTGKNVTPAI